MKENLLGGGEAPVKPSGSGLLVLPYTKLVIKKEWYEVKESN